MPLYAALIVTAVARLTRFVEAGKEALLAPAGTITVAGTETMEELPLDSVAAVLPDGAGAAQRDRPGRDLPSGDARRRERQSSQLGRRGRSRGRGVDVEQHTEP